MTAMLHPTRPEVARPWLSLTLFLATLVLASSPVRAQSGPLEDLAKFPQGKLEISAAKVCVFEVWVADTPARQQQGLMFVRSLPPLRGMLFVHENPRPMSMWMKNTYIPLDMVVIDSKGRIQEIVENATPHSLDTIRSKLPARAVLEIGGGEARRLGIKAGQQVRHPAFGAGTTP
jgi:uncharacterized membrane protein (UPF0127 family)